MLSIVIVCYVAATCLLRGKLGLRLAGQFELVLRLLFPWECVFFQRR